MSTRQASVSSISPPEVEACNKPEAREVHSFAMTGLFVLAIAYTAYVAQAVLIPALIGFMLSMILATPVRYLVAWRVPRSVASALTLLLVAVSLAVPIYLLSDTASDWLQEMPSTASEIAEHIKGLTVPIQDVKEVAEEVERLTQIEESDNQPTKVVVEPPGLAQTMLDRAPQLVASGIFAFFLAFLFLSSGDAMLRKIICMICALDDQKRSLLITRHIQQDLFRYLAAVTAVNLGLGAATAGILYVMDVPNALLWGGVAALFNYAPLVGPAITIVILAVVGMTTFEHTGQALLVPFSYFVLTSIEGQLISPAVIGRRLALSPVVVLLSLVTLGWMWGMAGLLLAVPIVSSTRIICANIPRLNNVAILLGR